MSGLLMSHREKISCMWHFQTVVLFSFPLPTPISQAIYMQAEDVGMFLYACIKFVTPIDMNGSSSEREYFLMHNTKQNFNRTKYPCE